MSSAAHWLVLGTFASRERVLSTWGTQRLTRTRSICMLIEHKHLHRQRKGKKKKKVCSFRYVTFRGLKSHTVIKSWSCASVHQLATPPHPLLQFPASSFPYLSQCHPCAGGEVAAILDSLKTETGKKKKKISPCLHQLLLQYLSSQIIFMSSAEFVKLNILCRLNSVGEEDIAWKSPVYIRWWKTGLAAGNRDQGTALSQMIRYCVWEPTLMSSVFIKICSTSSCQCLIVSRGSEFINRSISIF